MADDYTATATKAANESAAFESDSVDLGITDPLAAEIFVRYGTVQASPVETDRPNAATATREVIINNVGGRSVSLSNAEIVGTAPDQFEIVSSVPSSVPAGETRTVTVAFRLVPCERV